ncbi:outer membrane beta-barrel protein [Halobacteriovorax sp.]|uniref:outer membrane beta-barrel protein n=1 Tax=Halobacteriovorax sp. TaxID=2020862 RepID=UPI003561A3DE
MHQKYLIKTFIAFLISFNTSAFTYVGVAGNYSKVSYEPMEQYQVKPTGTGLGYMLGFRSGFLALEFSYVGVSASGDIIHDSVSNKILHDQKTYGVNMNLFLNKRLYFKFGYGVYKLDHTLETDVASHTRDAIANTYGFKNESHGGLSYGLGFNFFKVNKGFNLYTSIDRYQFDSEGVTTTVQLGIKYIFKLGFQSLIGR